MGPVRRRSGGPTADRARLPASAARQVRPRRRHGHLSVLPDPRRKRRLGDPLARTSGARGAVLLATAGLRRFGARLEKVAILAGVVVLIGSLAAYQADHASNPGF